MRHALRLHPDSPCLAASRIDVELNRPSAGVLLFSYLVTGRTDELKIPSITAKTRSQELWQTTCFEAFIRNPADGIYYELNFAPSTQWAAYRFDRYRSGMRDAAGSSAPQIHVTTGPGRFTLQVSLDLDWLPKSLHQATWRLGLAAIIEETSGHKSYWALAHPPGKPDFHHPDSFTQDLSPVQRP